MEDDIVLRVTIPAIVESPLMLKILSENPDMTRAQAHAEALRRMLGGWMTVDVVSPMST